MLEMLEISITGNITYQGGWSNPQVEKLLESHMTKEEEILLGVIVSRNFLASSYTWKKL